VIETNWNIITGPPSSGKTTLINELSNLGYQVVHEVARYLLNHLSANSKLNINHIRRDTLELQRKMLALKLAKECRLPTDEPIFFDRGTPDSIAYFNFFQLDSKPAYKACQHRQYKHIFYCSGLPVEHDGLRTENNVIAKKLGKLTFEAYISLGYQPIILPVVSVEKRIEIILNHLFQK